MSFDALAFCRDYRIKYWQDGNNVKNGWVNITCPLCNDTSNHGGFNPGAGYYHCWRCGGHSLEYIVSKVLFLNKQKSEALLINYSGGVSFQKLKAKPSGVVSSVSIPGEPLDRLHRRYLRRRGFDPILLQSKYGLTGTGIAGDWKYRIMIPIFYQGRLISYQGRDITDKQKLRYKTLSPEKSVINPKHILFNLDNCRTNTVCVVEGVFDVFRMGDGFAATLGTSMTEYQIKLLSDYGRVIFLFDPEPAAQERARRAAGKLAALGVFAELIDLEIEKDPGELTEEEAVEVRNYLGV